MTRTIVRSFAIAIAFALLATASPAHSLLLCAKLNGQTGELKDGSPIKLRTACKLKQDGTPKEIAIGSTEQLAALTTVAGRLSTISSSRPNGSTPLRWSQNGDGTVNDQLTGLQWEMKTDDGSIHDKDNTYSFSLSAPFDPDGTAFTVFLAGLNTEPCFGGHCDWRMPTLYELQTLIQPADPDCSSPPCTTIPGEMRSDFHFSSTRVFPSLVWGVHFANGAATNAGPILNFPIRAVRGGS